MNSDKTQYLITARQSISETYSDFNIFPLYQISIVFI